MADDTQLGAPSGTGDVISTDDLGTKKVQRVKVQHGADGSATDVSTASPLPAVLQTAQVADGGTLPATGVQVGGTDGSVFQVLSTDNAGRLNTNVNGTVPVSAASLPLPAGASTSAKQPALGTAGAASADVISVQGVASMTAVKTDGSAVTQPVSGTVTATLGATTNAGATAKTSDYDTGAGTDTVTSFGIALPASGGAVQGGTSTNPVRTDPTGTTTQPVSGTVTANAGSGTLAVSAASLPLPTGASTSAKQPALGTAGAASGDVITVQGVASMTALKVDGSAVTQPVSLAGTQSVNQAQVAGTATDTNSGVKGAGTQRIVIATDQPALTNALKVDPSAVTSPVSLASLPALATGSNLIGRVNLEPETTGGLSIFHLVSAATTNATNVKASAGQLYGWYIYNSNAAARKVAFHNTAGTPTAGASVSFAIVIPPTSAANVEFAMGIAFATGIGISTVTDLTDAGATAVAASDLIINLFFK
jgi:hypothetical protein